MYAPDVTSTIANKLLKTGGDTSSEMYAPIIVPGIDISASFREKPKKVSTGTTMNPPPSPIMDPSIPATKPSGKSHRYSNNYTTKIHFLQIKESRQPS